MRLKKTALFFHALSDERRLALLDRLKGGEHCVCGLTDAMNPGQSRLPFHLKLLTDAALLRDRREGRDRGSYYRVKGRDWNEVIAEELSAADVL
ncbi:metalloregulator ArsR/SmtB family transcription factor [Nitrospira sp. Nam74]